MIDEDILFDSEVLQPNGVWFGAESDSVALASGVEYAMSKNAGFVSVVPGAVDTVWPWLENKNIDIYARFYIENARRDFSEFVVAATRAFKHGANGAQVFMYPQNISNFVQNILPVRDDLFFNRKLFVGIDVCTVDANDWNVIFDSLSDVRADGLILMYTHENGDKSDFVGRVMNMIDAWNDNFNGVLYVSFGANFMRIEQVLRLMKYEKPNIPVRIIGTVK